MESVGEVDGTAEDDTCDESTTGIQILKIEDETLLDLL